MADRDNVKNLDSENNDNNIDWIVTPGLRDSVEEFIKLCEVAYSPSNKEMKKNL